MSENKRLKEDTRRILDNKIEQVTYALEETQLEVERRRLQNELVAMELARDTINTLNDSDLTRLHERLRASLPEWIERSRRRAL